MSTEKHEEKKYDIKVRQTNKPEAIAEAHGQKISFAMKADPNAGFTAPETVLGAYGACILININKAAANLGLKIDDARVEFTATKRWEPLGFENLKYTLIIKSSEPKEKLEILYQKGTTNGTATNALLEGLKPQSKLEIES